MNSDERTHLSLPGELYWRECLSWRRTIALCRGSLERRECWWTQRGDPLVLHFGWPLFHQRYWRLGSSWTQPAKSARWLRAFCLDTVARLQHVFGYCHPGNGDGWVCHSLICGSGEFTFAIAVSYHQIGYPDVGDNERIGCQFLVKKSFQCVCFRLSTHTMTAKEAPLLLIRVCCGNLALKLTKTQ